MCEIQKYNKIKHFHKHENLTLHTYIYMYAYHFKQDMKYVWQILYENLKV